jgi:CRISPR/Cas system-associated endonuclease/helicase Cas3
VSEDELSSSESSIKPYNFQKELYKKLKSLAESGGLIVVEAPTASGKTEAAAAPFSRSWRMRTGDWRHVLYIRYLQEHSR